MGLWGSYINGKKKGNQVYNPTYRGYKYDITPLATGRGPTLCHLQPNHLPASQQDPNPTTQRNPSTVDITDSCRFWTCISEKPTSFEVTLIMPRSLVCRGLHTWFLRMFSCVLCHHVLLSWSGWQYQYFAQPANCLQPGIKGKESCVNFGLSPKQYLPPRSDCLFF